MLSVITHEAMAVGSSEMEISWETVLGGNAQWTGEAVHPRMHQGGRALQK